MALSPTGPGGKVRPMNGPCERCGNPRQGRVRPGRFCSRACAGAARRTDVGPYLEANCIPEPNTGCWLWLGRLTDNGYGIAKVYRDGRKTSTTAHRLAYETWVGPVPDEFEVDHLCSCRVCIAPFHLEAVTRSENSRRALKRGISRRGGTCRKGHMLAGGNVTPEGWCRECRARTFERFMARRLAQGL